MFLTLITTILASASVSVYNPRIPVILDREYNVVSEIVIPGTGSGTTSGEVEVSLEGIPLKAVKDVKLVYIGTISPILSRTKSNVMRDHFADWGSGQGDWYGPRSTITDFSMKPKSRTFTLPFERTLVKGDNHFYVSMSISSKDIDLTGTFSCKVNSVTLDGVKASIKEQGPSDGRRYAIALRNHGDDGVDSYRIPGLVTLKNGDLMAVYDIRWTTSFDLQADIDIGFQVSRDGGRSWGKMKVAMDMGEYGGLPKDQNGTGDPCVLVDDKTGDIYIFAIWAHGLEGSYSIFNSKTGLDPSDVAQMVMVKSTDGGRTWSKPVNLTPSVKDPSWSTIFQGPGRGITMQDGTLVVPIQIWDKDKVPSAGIMYSKDRGENWTVSEMASVNVCEDQVVEIEPGVLMLNMRNHGVADRDRKVCLSRDLGKTWTPLAEDPVLGPVESLVEPVCQASLLKAEDVLLFANPATDKARNMFTLKASRDSGRTWSYSLLLDEESGWGYSCMTMIDTDTVGILYEGSTSQLVFQAVKLSDLLSR